MNLHQTAAPARSGAAELSRAKAQAQYWQSQHAEACRLFAQHECDDLCVSGDHHLCVAQSCAWNGCDCACHSLPEADLLFAEEPGLLGPAVQGTVQ